MLVFLVPFLGGEVLSEQKGDRPAEAGTTSRRSIPAENDKRIQRYPAPINNNQQYLIFCRVVQIGKLNRFLGGIFRGISVLERYRT